MDEEQSLYDDEAMLDDMDGFGYEEDYLVEGEDFDGELFDFEGGEADEFGFLKKAWRGIKKGVKKLTPIAKHIAPLAGKVIGGAFGGPAGAMVGSKLGSFVGSLEDELYEGYDEFDGYDEEGDSADEMDAEDFVSFEGDDEDMAEYMADVASKAPSSTDSQAMAGAITTTIASKAPIQVKQVAPTMASAAGRLTKLVTKSPKTKPLVKVVPAIAKKTVATLAKKTAKGKKVTPTTAKRVMAKHAVRVLGNPRELTKALVKNEAKKRKVNAKAVMRAERYV